jgi:glycosyltransferase involved in cell wall biosynthesis
MGGVERYLLNILSYQKAHEFSSVVLTRYYPPLHKREILPDYTVYRLGFNVFPFTRLRYVAYVTRLLDSKFSYSLLGRFEALRIINQVDIIHSHLGDPWDVLLGTKLASMTGKKHIVTIHGKFGCESEDIALNNGLLRNLAKADILVTNRKATYNTLASHGINDVVVLTNPIPVSEYERPSALYSLRHPDRTRAIFVGRLSHRRGAHLAVEGFVHAAEECTDIELAVIGDGPLASRLRESVQQVGLQNRVKFLGKQLDVRRFLWQSDIFLATSPIANSPSLALREAMSAACAVVATDVEETKDVIQQYGTGVVVEPNAHGIGNAILELHYDYDLRQRLGKSAEDFAKESFNMNLHMRRLIEIYNRLMLE